MTNYRISTNSVRPLEDAPTGSYEWMPFEDDCNVTVVPIAKADELPGAVAAAVSEHFDLFPDAVACKAFVDKARGEARHVPGGKRFCDRSVPMVLRTPVTA